MSQEIETYEPAKRTGAPRSKKGKAASAMNALKHGIRSQAVLASESKESLEPFAFPGAACAAGAAPGSSLARLYPTATQNSSPPDAVGS